MTSLNACPGFDGTLSLRITTFDGTTPAAIKELGLTDKDAVRQMHLGDSVWEVSVTMLPSGLHSGAWEGAAVFTLTSGVLYNANVALRVDFTDWSRDNYVLMPAAVYNGNRFKVLRKKYPPMLHEEDGIGVDMPVTITDVPHLKESEQARLHLRSGDMATPCMGFRSPDDNKGFLLLGDHNTPFGYTGFLLDEAADGTHASLQLEVPAVRETRYQWGQSDAKSDDTGYDFRTGDRVELRFILYTFDCPDISTLYTWYCNTRKDLSGEPVLSHTLPFSQAFRIIEEKYHKSQWNAEQEYWMVGPQDSGRYGDWQAGWVGGGMNSLALLTDGSELSRDRSKKTMDTIFGKLQAEAGYIYPVMHQGRLLGDDFDNVEDSNMLLIRKNADLLIFAARHIMLLQKRGQTVPPNWLEGFKKLADAFVRLWNKYGQFGQFIDIGAEEIRIGGTASGSTAPGGLALAAIILDNDSYMDIAKASGLYYYDHYLKNGLTNGGPGEILQGPDSESAFGLLESYVALYETTGNADWLPIAEDCAKQCASWCVSYDFCFPQDSVFGRMDMRTAGSVYANVQNKHSAPGICTLSGVSLLKLYRATGNEFYLKLCREISHNITQYLSHSDRAILSWDDQYLPSGWMCERVNMSDWETKSCIGGVFCGSCWCEVSALLTYTEIPGVWLLTDTGEAVVFDHVEARVSDGGEQWRVALSNPTGFDADVKIYAESQADFSRMWGECTLADSRVVHVPAGGSTVVQVRK